MVWVVEEGPVSLRVLHEVAWGVELCLGDRGWDIVKLFVEPPEEGEKKGY